MQEAKSYDLNPFLHKLDVDLKKVIEDYTATFDLDIKNHPKKSRYDKIVDSIEKGRFEIARNFQRLQTFLVNLERSK